MSTAPSRRTPLRLVAATDHFAAADLAASEIMEYIDTHYPEVWLPTPVPTTARTGIRNFMVRAILNTGAKR